MTIKSCDDDGDDDIDDDDDDAYILLILYNPICRVADITRVF